MDLPNYEQFFAGGIRGREARALRHGARGGHGAVANAAPGDRQRYPQRSVAVRCPGRGGRDRRRAGAGCGAARDQPVGKPGAGARPERTRPAELCAGPAVVHPRFRRAFDIRRARCPALCRRHSRHHARRPGAAVPHRPGLRRPHRGTARPVLRALRKFLGRSAAGLYRTGRGPAPGHDQSCGRKRWPGAARFASQRSYAVLGLCRQRQRLGYRWLA